MSQLDLWAFRCELAFKGILATHNRLAPLNTIARNRLRNFGIDVQITSLYSPSTAAEARRRFAITLDEIVACRRERKAWDGFTALTGMGINLELCSTKEIACPST